jgi:hypothetical protein
MLAVIPIPRARIRMAAAAKPGLLASDRHAYRTSRQLFSKSNLQRIGFESLGEVVDM